MDNLTAEQEDFMLELWKEEIALNQYLNDEEDLE